MRTHTSARGVSRTSDAAEKLAKSDLHRPLDTGHRAIAFCAVMRSLTYWRPVMSAARLPEHTGQPEYHVDKILPSCANLSMFGVRVLG
jgi:hypothetical protein